jgi:hypothetical protein
MTLESIQAQPEMSIRHAFWAQRRLEFRTEKLITFMYRLFKNSGSLNPLEIYKACPFLYRDRGVKAADA